MSPIAMTPNQTIDYVLECDRDKPKEERTIFHIRYLTAQELGKLEDGIVGGKFDGNNMPNLSILKGSTTIQALLMGLVGWTNFKDAEGREVEFKRRSDRCAKENLDYLRPEWRRELAEQITEMNTLTEEEEKN